MDIQLLAWATAALIGFQGALMAVDEFYFHWRRGLGRWESIGHPIDSLFYLAALAIPALLPWAASWARIYVFAAVVSTLVITKDEWIHTKEASATEHWLHALLFVVHPPILVGTYLLWQHDAAPLLRLALPTAILVFMIYQISFWNFFQGGKFAKSVITGNQQRLLR